MTGAYQYKGLRVHPPPPTHTHSTLPYTGKKKKNSCTLLVFKEEIRNDAFSVTQSKTLKLRRMGHRLILTHFEYVSRRQTLEIKISSSFIKYVSSLFCTPGESTKHLNN